MVYKFKKKFKMVKERLCARLTTYNKKSHFNHLDRSHKDKKNYHDYANLDRPCIVSNKNKVQKMPSNVSTSHNSSYLFWLFQL